MGLDTAELVLAWEEEFGIFTSAVALEAPR